MYSNVARAETADQTVLSDLELKQHLQVLFIALLLANQKSGKLTVRSHMGANYKKILRLSYDVIITYDNRKSNLR